MALFLLPLLALVVALLRGGSFDALLRARIERLTPFTVVLGDPATGRVTCIRGIPFLALALAIQITLYLPGLRSSPFVLAHGGVVYSLTMVCLVAYAAANWGWGAGARLLTLGLALNTLVICANGGYMPTSAQAQLAAGGAARAHELADRGAFVNERPLGPDTRLAVLGDLIPLRVPPLRGNVYSAGDVLVSCGLALLLYRAMRPQVQSGASSTRHDAASPTR